MNGRVTRETCWWRQVAFCLFAMALGIGSSAKASDREEHAPPRIVDIRAGFDGRFKVGYWTPFEVTIQGGGKEVRGRVELTVLDGDAVPSRVTAGETVTVAPGEQVSVSLYAKIGQLRSDVTAGFRAGGQLLASRRFSTAEHEPLGGILPSGQELIVTLGSPLTADDEASFGRRHAKVANLARLDQLPADWWGYEGASVVILATGADEISSQLSAGSVKIAALDEWVRMGGKLILGVGRQAEKVLASEAPLAQLAPGVFEALVPLRQSTMLEMYAETSEPVDRAAGPLALEVPKLAQVRGKIEAYAGLHPRDLPLVVRAPHGFGEVVFVAFDLEQAPLATWTARAQLFDKLLRRSKATSAESESGTLGQVTTLGFVDLAGQLRGALDQFAGVELAPFWLVAVLVLAYIACIGPLDYFIVKKVFGRMEATWLTFSLTVVVFSAGAFLLAYELKGRELCINQVEVVDFDAETALVRGTLWANLFSPTTDTYNLSIRPPAKRGQGGGPNTIFSWLGLPGTGFGGMDHDKGLGGLDPSAGSMPLFTEPYDFASTLNGLEHVPIAIWSSKALIGRWHEHAAAGIEAQLSDQGKLVGTLTSHLDGPLEDCVLFYDRWAYPMRRLSPGQAIDVETALEPQTVHVDTYLRHVTSEGDRNVAAPYDRASFDVPRIIEIMTLHDLAGGEKYTGLSDAYQGFVDLSGLVHNGRAVLIGRKARGATVLERDGKPLASPGGQHWTFYRYVFPVRQ